MVGISGEKKVILLPLKEKSKWATTYPWMGKGQTKLLKKVGKIVGSREIFFNGGKKQPWETGGKKKLLPVTEKGKKCTQNGQKKGFPGTRLRDKPGRKTGSWN